VVNRKINIVNSLQQKPNSQQSAVGIWLLIGVFMLLMQIVIGGVTRLTGSGLSITKWEIVTGTIPPIGEAEWQEAFDLYKASPQYAKINQGMEMGDFKFIFFWEYFHRLWARLMGFVFLFPFIYFLAKGYLRNKLALHLIGVVTLAMVVASFGWIMVASGLVSRPYVNAYKLTLHLMLGISLFAYVFWLAMNYLWPRDGIAKLQGLKGWSTAVVLVAVMQLILGGLMSGMKAGLFFPTWPDMNGAMLPDVLLDNSQWHLDAFKHYDTNAFAPAIVQFVHRGVAYILTALVLVFTFKAFKQQPIGPAKFGFTILPILLLVQVTLGIVTVVNSLGTIPVSWGVLHQAGGVLLLANLVFVRHFCLPKSQ
jgi:cytochrome c oxidase assembly protein subunit 15